MPTIVRGCLFAEEAWFLGLIPSRRLVEQDAARAAVIVTASHRKASETEGAHGQDLDRLDFLMHHAAHFQPHQPRRASTSAAHFLTHARQRALQALASHFPADAPLDMFIKSKNKINTDTENRKIK